MSIFKIRIKAGTPAVYDPSPLNVQPNDSVFWYNADQTKPHWPTPDPAKPKAWLAFQIAPDSQSAQISLNPLNPLNNPPANYTLNYVCSLHPGEKGQIRVVGKSKKGAFGGKTKKGAFGGKTKKGAFSRTTKKGALASTTKKGALANTTKKGALSANTKKGALSTSTKKGAFGKNTK